MRPDPRTTENKRQWDRKPSLRRVYHDLYRRMAAARIGGSTLEVGGGSGIFKLFDPDVLSVDLRPAPGIDLVADAQALPFRAASFANIVLFDVLHHVEFPRRFFAEAERVLSPGGRLIMMEPAVTWASWPVYRFAHAEPVVLGQDPLAEGQGDPLRDPFDANTAIPTLLFGRHQSRFLAAFPGLVLRELDWLSLLAYPLTGGFQTWSLLPERLAEPLLRLEDRVPRALRRRIAFRLFVVLEKAHGTRGMRELRAAAET